MKPGAHALLLGVGLVALAGGALALPSASLYAVSPATGSFAGGTYLTLKGVGWTRDGMAGMTQVFINGKECKQNQGVILDSTDTNFICWTPPYFEWNEIAAPTDAQEVPIKIVLTLPDGTTYEPSYNCGGFGCTFTYRKDKTPVVLASSTGVTPGGLLKVHGRLRHADSFNYWVRTGGDTSGGGVEGALCFPHGPIQAGAFGRGGPTTLTSSSDDGLGTIVCRMGSSNSSSEAGRYPLHVEARDNGVGGGGYGQPFFSERAAQNRLALPQMARPVTRGEPVDFKSVGFGVTVYPVVHNVSVRKLGTVGGAIVRISGDGFALNAASNEVFLGETNVPCTIIDHSRTHITCRAGAAAASTPAVAANKFYPSGSGLFYSVIFHHGSDGGDWYMGQSIEHAMMELAFAWLAGQSPITIARSAYTDNFLDTKTWTPDLAGVSVDAFASRLWYGNKQHNWYSQHLEGFFVAPATAEYTFYVRGDAGVILSMSADDNPANLTIIAAMPHIYPGDGDLEMRTSLWAAYYFRHGNPRTQYRDAFQKPGPISRRIAMEKGKAYFVRLIHFDDGNDNDEFDVGMRIHLKNSDGTDNDEVRNTFVSDAQKESRAPHTVIHVAVPCDSGYYGLQVSLDYSVLNPANEAQSVTTTAIKCDETNRDTVRNLVANAIKNQLNYGGKLEHSQDAFSFLERGGTVSSFGVVDARYDTTLKHAKWTFDFRGPIARLIALAVQAAPLASPEIAGVKLANVQSEPIITLVEDGRSPDPFYWPVPLGDFFQTALPYPGVKVKSNGLLAACQHVRPATPPAPDHLQKANWVAKGFDGTFQAIPAPFNPQGWASYSLDAMNGCAVIYDASVNPTVSEVTVQGGGTAIKADDVIVIAGTNFLPAASGKAKGPSGLDLSVGEMNFVTLLGTSGHADGSEFPCVVFEATGTELKCSVSYYSAGTYTVKVNIGLGRGKPVMPQGISFTYSPTPITLSPASGSINGGTILRLRGSGLPTATSAAVSSSSTSLVTVDGVACRIVSASLSEVTCLVPAYSGATTFGVGETHAVDVVIAGNSDFHGTFTYASASTPVITSMDPTSLGSAVTKVVTLVVGNIPASEVAADGSLSEVSVKFGDRICEVVNTTVTRGTSPDTDPASASVRCLLKRSDPLPLPQNAVAPVVKINNLGVAATVDALGQDTAPNGGWKLDTGFRVAAVSPQVGSLEGGTLITITGHGFKTAIENIGVSIEFAFGLTVGKDVGCTVKTVSDDGTSLTCITSRPDWDNIDLKPFVNTTVAGNVTVYVNQIAAKCVGILDGTCAFTFDIAKTPVVTAAAFDGTAGNVLITGQKFESLELSPISVWLGTVPSGSITVNTDKTEITATLPAQAAGATSLWVNCPPFGNARGSWLFSFFNPLKVTSIEPAAAPGTSTLTGSTKGGHALVLKGSGFSTTLARNLIRFGAPSNLQATVIAASSTELTILTPSATSAADATITVKLLEPLLKSVVATASGSWTYTYVDTTLPQVSSVSPITIAAGGLLTITGTNFGDSKPAQSFVSLGGVDCPTTDWAATSINCTVGNVPAGVHAVVVVIGTTGNATSSAVAVTVALTLNAPTPTSVGAGGSVPVKIGGAGFSTLVENNVVKVCGIPAKVIKASYTELTFLSPVLPVASLNDRWNTYQDQPLKGTVLAKASPTAADSAFALATAAQSQAFDGNATSAFSGVCSYIVDLGEHVRSPVLRIRFFPKIGSYNTFIGSTFSAGNSMSGPWTQLVQPGLTVLDEVNSGWNFWDSGFDRFNLTSKPQYRYLRWDAAKSSDCSGMEMQFIGRPMIKDDGAACPVEVTVTTPATPYALAVTSPAVASTTNLLVDTSKTPVVDALTPDSGTALGGIDVTITGSGFTGVNGVSFNGVPCDVKSSTSTSIVCTTRARPAIMAPQVIVNVTNYGIALVNDTSDVFFSYMDRWSALTTWSYNELPAEGDTVFVPRGQSLLIDVSPPRIFLFLVQGELYFEDKGASGAPIDFHVHYLVSLGGKIYIGTEKKPYEGKLTMTFHGNRSTAVEIPGCGAKTLCVMNSMGDLSAMDSMHTEHIMMRRADPAAQTELTQLAAMKAIMGSSFGISRGVYTSYQAELPAQRPVLDVLLEMFAAPDPGAAVSYEDQGVIEIHGKPRKRVWTFGGATAAAGSWIITTNEDTDWQVGETLAISSTSVDPSQAERVVIAERIDARTFNLTVPLKYTHECFVYPSSQFGFTDTRICYEVGLLTRNVKITGDEFSEAEQFGMHSIAAMGAVMRAENAEWTNCGQSLIVGRYCMHLHLLASTPSYIKGNSVHDGFQRAVTVHATDNLLVQNNFAYRVMAHTFFVEDGVEMNNVFDSNLVIEQLTSPGPIRTDAAASCFWSASNTNHWINNVCGGSYGHGWWFQPPPLPTGPSQTDRIHPQKMPLGSFVNNTAHSATTGVFLWLILDPIFCNDDTPQYVRNSTFWRNGAGMFIGASSPSVQWTGNKLLENGLLWHHICENRFSDKPHLANTLLVATMNVSILNAGTVPQGRGLYLPEDDGFFVSNLTAVNFGKKNAATAACGYNGCVCYPPDTSNSAKQSSNDADPSRYTVRMSGIKLVNSSEAIYWHRMDAVVDLDGSLSGKANSYLTPYHGYNHWPGDCDRDSTGIVNGGLVCKPGITVRKVAFNDVMLPSGKSLANIKVANDTSSDARWTATEETINGEQSVMLASGHTYGVQFKANEDWLSFSIAYSTPSYLAMSGTSNNEPLSVTMKRIQEVYEYKSTYPSCSDCKAVIKVPQVDRSIANPIDSASSTIGSITWPYGPQTSEFKVLLSKKIPASSPYVINATKDAPPFSVGISFARCPPEGCYSITTGALGGPVLWSSLSWNTSAPKVVVNATQWVLLDVSPPPMKQLHIQGRLEFMEGKDVTLTAESIVVLGSFAIGNATRPFRRRAEIVLTGNLYSKEPVLGENVWTGGKGLICLGNCSLYGVPRKQTWLLLASTANVGDKTLNLANCDHDFAPGEKIVLTSSEWPSHLKEETEVETATIDGVSGDGCTLTLSTGLTKRHYAGPLSSSADSPSHVKNRKVAAAVGLLSRNIIFRGDLTSSPNAGTFGARVLATSADLGTKEQPAVFTGSFQASFVQFANLAQYDMPWSGIQIDMPLGARPSAPSFLDGISIDTTFHNAIAIKGYRGFSFTRNVVYASVMNGIFFDSRSPVANVTGNLIVGNYYASDVYLGLRGGTGGGVIAHGQAGITMNTVPVALRDNYVSAVFESAFVLPPDDCSNAGSSFMSNNHVAGAGIGVFVLPGNPFASRCGLVTDFTIVGAGYMGVHAHGQFQDIRLTNSVVSDAHIGIFFFFKHEASYLVSSLVKNVTIIGTSPASSGCTKSVTCRNAGAYDHQGVECNSMFGGNVRRIGYVIPINQNDQQVKSDEGPYALSHTSRGNWFGCSLYWDVRHGNGHGPFHRADLENVTFSSFAGTGDCSKESKAIALHPNEWDQTVPLYAKKVVFDSVSNAARFKLPANNRPMIVDSDGSLLDLPAGGTLLGSKADDGVAPSACVAKTEFGNAYWCPPTGSGSTPLVFRNIMVTSMDVLRKTEANVLATTEFTRLQPYGTGDATAAHEVDSRDGCSLASFLMHPHLNALVLANSTVKITMSSTEPVQTRFRFNSPEQNEKVLVQFFLTRPNSQAIFVNGNPVLTAADLDSNKGIPVSRLPLPTLDQPVGTALFRSDLKTLYLVLAGGYSVVDIIRQPSVVVSMTFVPPPGTDPVVAAQPIVQGLASLLGIDAKRIRVVNVAALPSRRQLIGLYGGRLLATNSSNIQFEILPQTTVQLQPDPVTAPVTLALSSNTTTNMTADQAIAFRNQNAQTLVASNGNVVSNETVVSNATTSNFQQETQMVQLGAVITQLVNTGSLAANISAVANITLLDIGVAVPNVTTVLPNVTYVPPVILPPPATPAPTPASTPNPTQVPTTLTVGVTFNNIADSSVFNSPTARASLSESVAGTTGGTCQVQRVVNVATGQVVYQQQGNANSVVNGNSVAAPRRGGVNINVASPMLASSASFAAGLHSIKQEEGSSAAGDNGARLLAGAGYTVTFTIVFPSLAAATNAASAIAANGGATFAQSLVSNLANSNPSVWGGVTVTGVSTSGVGNGFVTVSLAVTAASNNTSTSGLSVGALAGIICAVVVAGIICALAIAVAMGWMPCNKKRGDVIPSTTKIPSHEQQESYTYGLPAGTTIISSGLAPAASSEVAVSMTMTSPSSFYVHNPHFTSNTTDTTDSKDKTIIGV